MQNKIRISLITILCFLATSQILLAQGNNYITYTELGNNKIQFQATNLPKLIKKTGAPTEPFYTYYWEFGDGHISREESPIHEYKSIPTQDVQLMLVDNYSDGGDRPRGRMANIGLRKKLKGLKAAPADAFPEDRSRLQIQPSFIPSGHQVGEEFLTAAEDELAYVISYRNTSSQPLTGELYLFFNEKGYDSDNFALTGNARTYHKEQEDLTKRLQTNLDILPKKDALDDNETLLAANGVESWSFIFDEESKENSWDVQSMMPSAISEASEVQAAQRKYGNYLKWNFANMPPRTQRRIFQDFTTLIDDVTAVVHFQAIFVPTNGGAVQTFTLNMMVVSAHDPNKIYVDSQKKDFSYKIKFQNEGDGPAEKVVIHVDMDKKLKYKSVDILEAKIGEEAVRICKDENDSNCIFMKAEKKRITFEYRNIYLPGTGDKTVKKEESIGYVEYKLNAKNRNKVIGSRAEIIFDNEPPIRTNHAVVKPKNNIAFAVKGGFNNVIDNGFSDWFVGGEFAFHRRKKWYYQAELMYTQGSYSNVCNPENQEEQPINDFTYNRLDVVPVMLGYEIKPWLRVGGGLQLSFLQKLESQTVAFSAPSGDGTCTIVDIDPMDPEILVENFSTDEEELKMLETSPFLDLNFGLKNVRLGSRYYFSFTERFGLSDESTPRGSLQLYGEFRF